MRERKNLYRAVGSQDLYILDSDVLEKKDGERDGERDGDVEILFLGWGGI